jgi:hypothetical protein
MGRGRRTSEQAFRYKHGAAYGACAANGWREYQDAPVSRRKELFAGLGSRTLDFALGGLSWLEAIEKDFDAESPLKLQAPRTQTSEKLQAPSTKFQIAVFAPSGLVMALSAANCRD